MLQTQQILQGRYQLQQQLGQNLGRHTWVADDVGELQTKAVIVKFLAFNPQMQWDELKLFEREAQVLKHLNHPRIPQYQDYFSLEPEVGNGLPWFGLVQEYIPGTSLAQLLNQGKRFTPEEVQKIAREVLEILIYLHELSPPVLHRDIKPSNLILGNDGKIYLVDFGAVQDRATAEGVTFTVVGTSGYAPPEQLWGRAVAASDLYALGATLIHLLTGTAPTDLPQRQMRIQFADRINLNFDFAQWLAQLTEPASERRYSTAKQALLELKAIQYKSSGSKKKRQYVNKVGRYRRLAGLMLIQLIVVGIPAYYIMLIAPSFLQEDDIDRAREMSLAVAKRDIQSMNRSQETYYQKNKVFFNSINDMTAVDSGISTQSETYNYSTEANAWAAFNYGVSRRDNLRSYVGGVFIPIEGNQSQINRDSGLVSIMCEANYPGRTKPNEPFYNNGVLICPPDTTKVSGNKN
jgi:serine/threonine protein kinase